MWDALCCFFKSNRGSFTSFRMTVRWEGAADDRWVGLAGRG